MTRGQPQYLIRANRNCKTHPRGMTMVMTGPRNSVTRGWTVVCRYHQF